MYGGDRVQRAHRIGRQAQRVADRRGGDQPDPQPGERARPDAGDHRAQLRLRPARAVQAVPDGRGEQLAVRPAVHGHPLGQHPRLGDVHQSGGNRRGGGVHNQRQHADHSSRRLIGEPDHRPVPPTCATDLCDRRSCTDRRSGQPTADPAQPVAAPSSRLIRWAQSPPIGRSSTVRTSESGCRSSSTSSRASASCSTSPAPHSTTVTESATDTSRSRSSTSASEPSR